MLMHADQPLAAEASCVSASQITVKSRSVASSTNSKWNPRALDVRRSVSLLFSLPSLPYQTICLAILHAQAYAETHVVMWIAFVTYNRPKQQPQSNPAVHPRVNQPKRNQRYLSCVLGGKRARNLQAHGRQWSCGAVSRERAALHGLPAHNGRNTRREQPPVGTAGRDCCRGVDFGFDMTEKAQIFVAPGFVPARGALAVPISAGVLQVSRVGSRALYSQHRNGIAVSIGGRNSKASAKEEY